MKSLLKRTKTIYLYEYNNLTKKQSINSELNIDEINKMAYYLKSYPRRIVLELTNSCNMECIMCGRLSKKITESKLTINSLSKLEKFFNIAEEVTMMGWGEPTSHPEFHKIVRYLDTFDVKKYLCTNGINLPQIHKLIFDNKIDIIAVSVNGSKPETNDYWRKGSNFSNIVENLKMLSSYKIHNKIDWPYLSFVFCAMKSNIHELPELVKLASDIGLNRVKVVYLTAFTKKMIEETLWNETNKVKYYFKQAGEIATQYNIELELPYIRGQDPAGELYHRECFVSWRDIFVGSDRYIRPCMSTNIKIGHLDDYYSPEAMWNSIDFMKFRKHVNNDEKMNFACKNCYQSSHCNWNNKKSFIQVGEEFLPEWD